MMEEKDKTPGWMRFGASGLMLVGTVTAVIVTLPISIDFLSYDESMILIYIGAAIGFIGGVIWWRKKQKK